jgi:hypothetical protein
VELKRIRQEWIDKYLPRFKKQEEPDEKATTREGVDAPGS